MPRTSPFTIRLTTAEIRELQRRAAKYTLPYFQVQRAKIVLLAAEGLTNDEIAARPWSISATPMLESVYVSPLL